MWPIYGTPVFAGVSATKVGAIVRTVLGLALTSSGVGWVLVDGVDASSTVLDYDGFETIADAQVADSAARGAAAIAAASGRKVDCVRVTWSDDVRGDGLQLLDKLKHLGFDDVAVVRLRDAIVRAGVGDGPDVAPWALACGAVLEKNAKSGASRVPLRGGVAAFLMCVAAAMIAVSASAGSSKIGNHDAAPALDPARAVSSVTPADVDHGAAMVGNSPKAPTNWVAVDPSLQPSYLAVSPVAVAISAPPARLVSPGPPTLLPDQPHLPAGEAPGVGPVQPVSDTPDQVPPEEPEPTALPAPSPDSNADVMIPIVAALP